VAGGDPVVAKVIVRNRTNGPASGVLTILVNNVPFDQREVQIAPAGSAEYRFTLVNDKPGLYQVKVIQGATAEVVTDVLESQYLVTSTLSEASWEIFGMEVTPQPGQLGEPMSVSFQVSNLGQREGELALVVEVNGTRELEETIRLSGLTTRQVSLPLAGRGEGTHNVSVNGTSIQFTVLGAPEPTPAPTQPPAQNQLGRIIATIVVLVVVGGVAGAAWRLRSRRQRG
jgi:hypothetical protein